MPNASRSGRNVLFQALLAIVAITAFAVLRSPSTITFFAFEVAVVLACGFYLGLRRKDMMAIQAGEDALEQYSPGESHPGSPWTHESKRSSRHLDDAASRIITPGRSRRVFYGANSLFVLLLSLAVLDLTRSLYIASVLFYGLVGLAAGVLALNILVNGENRTGSLLIQLTALATLLKLHFVILNPYVYTSDSYLFYRGLLDLSAAGTLVQSLGHYFYFPGFATYAYASPLVTGVPLELFAVFGFASQIAMLPIVYLLGRHVSGRTTGMFAAMFVLFSVYSFLYTHASPTHYGLGLLFLAVYAAIRIGAGRVWFALFWASGLAAMLSHPVNGLILGLVLAARVVGARLVTRDPMARGQMLAPVLSYATIYGSYLAFFAVTAFELFVTTFFVGSPQPPLATVPGQALEKTPAYVLQSGLAPIGIVLPIFFAAYALLHRRNMLCPEHGFLVTLGILFLAIPGLEVLGDDFRLQSSRMLVYFAIPFAFLGAHGLVVLGRNREGKRAALGLIIALFVAVGFVSSSSYLTQNDLNSLYSDVPFSPTHVTESSLMVRQYMELTPNESTVYFDSGSMRYFQNSNRARDPLSGRLTLQLILFQQSGGTGFVVLNEEFLPYGHPSAGSFYDLERIAQRIGEQRAPLLYDSGKVKVYFVG